MRRHALALCLPALLAGCNMAPAYVQPELPVPTAYPETTPVSGAQASAISWHSFFGDPQLQAYIGSALERNRDLAAAAARIAQAEAQYRAQASARLPNVDAGASAGRSRTPTAIGPQTISAFQVQFVVSSFELDLWGRVANLTEAARRNYLATVDVQRALRLTLIRDVATVYYAIRAGEAGIDVAQRTLASRRKSGEIARLRLDAGVTSKVDYQQAMILITQAQTQLADLQRTTDQQRNLLLLLAGGPMAQPLPDGYGINDAHQLTLLDAGLPSSLLTLRPDILAAEEQLRGANANIGAARAAFFPTISLTGMAGFLSPQLGNLFDGDSGSWAFGGGAGLPLFDFGRRRAQLALSKARRDELVAIYQRTVQQAFREVADGLVGRQRLQEQIAAQQRAVQDQRVLAETAELRYSSGVSVYLEVLDAERNLFTAEQQLILLRAAALQNDVALYAALGGGSI
ncbi:efflux transporter outer membrane subunit [Novosphingobium sp. ZW T3_23]|uniref:efflux transporter outer membrane subunit n=1 Tax=Novosphingobium sp. ZW T3_23 TaxID=3378084 RepID=UPI0038526D1F